MKKTVGLGLAAPLLLGLLGAGQPLRSQDGSIPGFPLDGSPIALSRLAQPRTYFDKVGRRFAILGLESGAFEAWAYPLKLVRDVELSFLIGTSTEPIPARDLVRTIRVTPAATTLTFVYQSFTIRATYVTAIEEPAAVVLLDVDAVEPLTVVCSFLPVLQPMWPAGLGGQYAYWDDTAKAYLISEPTRRNHGFLGSPGGRGISYTPAHMLADTPSQFKIEIPDPAAARGRLIPIVMAGGKGAREDIRKIYERIAADPKAVYDSAVAHYDRLLAETLRVATPDARLNLAWEWSKVALDNLLVSNPDLGFGLVAGLGLSGSGGRPGFGWFFGTDAYLNSLSLLGAGRFETVRDVLAFTRKWQRADGKMAHELSQAAGYIDWFKDYPYAYIHGDTTPYYIAAVDAYVRRSGDREFLQTSWPSLKKAFAWCLSTDEDGDGLMDNKKAGLGALEFGSLTGIRTDIYCAAVWLRACQAMEELARAAGDPELSRRAAGLFAKARRAFEDEFWDEETGQYSFAFNATGQKVKEPSPWSAYPLAWNLADPERGVRTLARLNESDLTTDWGVRILSNRSPLYEPLNYNYGAVWPFLTGWVATALFRHGFVPQGCQALASSVAHTFDNALGEVTELFSGAQNVWPQEAVAHQGFSTSGVALPLAWGLLGLDGDAARRTVVFEPSVPADWAGVRIEGFRVGEASFDFSYARLESGVRLDVSARGTEGAGWELRFAPALGLGIEVRGATLNGRPIPVETRTPAWAQAERPLVEVALAGSDRVEIDFEPTVEILPPANETATGDPDQGLKILRQARSGSELTVVCEGLAGREYRLGLRGAERADSVSGAAREGSGLTLRMPPGPAGSFVRTEIRLTLKGAR
jgi:hypothetical protein